MDSRAPSMADPPRPGSRRYGSSITRKWKLTADTYAGLGILEKLHAHPLDRSHIGAHEEFIQISRQLALERAKPAGNLFQLFKNPAHRKRLLMGFTLQAMCQTTGVLVISNYLVRFLAPIFTVGSETGPYR
jgi:hypothetical protein